MSNNLIPVSKIGRKQWLANRRRSIGASDSAAILGHSGYGETPYDVYISKVNGFQQPESPEMKLGTHLEPAILSMVAEVAKIELTGEMFARHPSLPFVTATADALVLDSKGKPIEGVEAKWVHWTKRRQWGEEGTDEIPDHVRIQVEQQMLVVGLPRVHVGALIGGDDFRHYVIERDRQLGAMILDAITEFWQEHVEKQIPPSMEDSRHAAQYLAQRYPRDLSPVVVADDLGAFLMQRRKRLTQAGALVKRATLFVDNQLKELIGERAGLKLHDGPGAEKVTWKKARDTKKIDWEGAARAAGVTDKQIKEHTTVKPGARRFLPDRRWKEIE